MERFRTYLDLLARIHRELRPRSYLEIGVRDGASLTLAMPGTKCVAVDPVPCIDKPTPRATTVHTMTSDDYFKGDDGKVVWDVAFIDGMHLAEFAMRDLLNVESRMNPAGVVFVHDCYPLDEVTASRHRTTDCWSGDVWKLIVALRDWRPDLAVNVVDVSPTGLGIITPRDGVWNSAGHDELERTIERLEYAKALTDKPLALNRVPNDWGAIAPLLPESFRAGERRLAFGRGMRTPRAYLTTGPRRIAARAVKRLRPASRAPEPAGGQFPNPS